MKSSLMPWSGQPQSSDDVGKHDLRELVLRILEIQRPRDLAKVSLVLHQVDSRHLAVWAEAVETRLRLLVDLQEILSLEVRARADLEDSGYLEVI